MQAMQEIFITRTIASAAREQHTSNWDNTPAFHLDLCIGSDYDTYRVVMGLVEDCGYDGDLIAAGLKALFDPRSTSLLGGLYLTGRLLAAMKRPIFPASLVPAMRERGKDDIAIVDALKKIMDENNPFYDGTRACDMYTDLLEWGSAWLDLRAYVAGEVAAWVPSWLDVLHAAFDAVDWRYLARHYTGA